MRKISFSCLLSLLVFALTSQAQITERKFNSRLDNYIRNVIQKIPEIPGLAIAVIKDDKPVFIRAYGMADKEKNIASDVNTLYYIASSTKSFTALAAALIDKEGVIKLDDPVTSCANNLKFRSDIPDKIVVRNLLTHTSGLKNNALTFRMAYTGAADGRDIIDVFERATQVVDSNYGKYLYDNLGYNIYALLLQQTMNKKWQDILQEKIFDPLGMKHTTTYPSLAAKNNWMLASPYIFTPDKGTTHTWLDKTDNNMQSAGGIFASITDIAAWLNMNMNKGKLNGQQIFPADVIEECQTGYTKTWRDQAPFTGDGEYGLGWQIGKYKNEKVIYHHGGFPGYRSHISFMPDKKIAVAVLINDGSIGGRAGHMIATYVYDTWLQPDSVDINYAKQLEDLSQAFERYKKSVRDGFTERAKRVSQLSLPLESYAGKYVNPYFGTFEISVKDSALAVRIGEMHCVSTNYIMPEGIRVELEPGSGVPMIFKKNAEAKIEALTYEDVEYTRVKEK